MARGVTKNCSACGHKLSLHGYDTTPPIVQAIPTPVVQPINYQQPVPQMPPSMPAGWFPDPTDNRALTWWDGTRWHPNTKHYPGR